MPKLQQFAHSLSVRLEMLLDQVENHEASAEAAIRQLQDLLMSVRRRQLAAARTAELLRGKLDESRRAETAWKERALRACDDEQQALTCVKRMQRAQEESRSLEAQWRKEQALDERLRSEVQTLSAKTQELKARCAVLVARSAHVQSTRLSGEPDSTFERWEAHVAQDESSSAESMLDPLEAQYSESEREAAARQALADLRASTQGGEQ